MINFFKKIKTTNGKELKQGYFELYKIVIKPEKIVVEFNIYYDKDSKELGPVSGVENRLIFNKEDKEFKALEKAITGKTKLLGKIKSLMGVE